MKAQRGLPNMGGRGNCHDPAVAESLFQLLPRERPQAKTDHDRKEARRGIFDYSERFSKPKHRHGSAHGLSPLPFEKPYCQWLKRG